MIQKTFENVYVRTGPTASRETVRSEATALRREHVLATVQVRLDMQRVTAESVAEYADAGVSELVMSLNTADVGEIDNALETFASAMF